VADTHTKNQTEQQPAHNLVKPGSTMDPKKAGAAGQGLGGQPGQQGQVQNQAQNQGQIGQQGLSEQDQKALQERQQQAWDAAAEREKSNNPATREQRQSYDKNAPGMHPANQPAPDTKLNKGTRLDLEDLTGNPGHRGVNPDAPANSINRGAPYDDSINEPHHIDQNWPKAGERAQGAAVTESINEPHGSQVIPPGAGAGTGEGVEHPPGSVPPGPGHGTAPKITSIEPDSVEIGGGNETFGLVVTGEGFDDTCKIVFDDEEVETEFVNETTLRATPPMSDTAEEVDVEVERGSETSEVLTFEFTAAGGAGSRQRKEPTRKPKKPTPSASRDKSGKKKKK
jgi:hypothetical protein